MLSKHLYNADGRWIAFIVGTDVFNRFGTLIGRFINNREIQNMDGRIMGFLSEDGHLVRERRKQKRSAS
jgi:hypothetical protein